MKFLNLVILCLVFNNISLAQDKFDWKAYYKLKISENKSWSNDIIHNLKIGDTLPISVIENVKNYKDSRINLKESKAKLIILDFWSITCHGCLEAIPKMDSLQKKFGDKIQVIMITRDDQKAVDFKLQTARVLKTTKLPMYNSDHLFYHYLEYTGLPEQIWIDSNRIIKSIDQGEATTYASIKNYLEGNYKVKYDFRSPQVFKDFNYRVPPFIEGNGRNFDKVQFYSVVMKRINGLGIRDRNDAEKDSLSNKYTSITLDNMNILPIYQYLLFYEYDYEHDADNSNSEYYSDNIKNRSKFNVFSWNRLLFLSRDSSLLKLDPEARYCYAIKAPLQKADKLFTIAKKDLEQYFGISGSIEPCSMKCQVLYRDSSVKYQKLITVPDYYWCEITNKDEKLSNGQCGFDVRKNCYYLKNVTIDQIVNFLSGKNRRSNCPIYFNGENNNQILFNVTIPGKSDNINLSRSELDPELTIQGLKKAGVIVREETRIVPMVVIKDVQ